LPVASSQTLYRATPTTYRHVARPSAPDYLPLPIPLFQDLHDMPPQIPLFSNAVAQIFFRLKTAF